MEYAVEVVLIPSLCGRRQSLLEYAQTDDVCKNMEYSGKR